ncbi:VirB4 family type IV secretion system protein [[Clostridium] polysaccharolyticum]|uniref:AAA-like domain-containing protein n=1 Tax=[Clostridium] polysaccharolyticum TaxID=29364 RepID=A0A1H9YAL0_9FIRM|nr:DUF87 domain-containing protein [[Clostridium] polysaccharolyticum]SES65488.1 AAA-like domain-containing protein [[Clostridium] polysaccharolyticum]
MRKKKEEIKPNNALINLIAPMGLDKTRNELSVGENIGKVFGVIRYPGSPDYGWLSKLTTLSGTICSYMFTPIDNSEFIMALNKNITHQKSIMANAQDELTHQRADKSARDGADLLMQIDQHHEAIGTISTLIMPMSNVDDSELLNRTCREVSSKCISAGLQVRLLSNNQLNAFQQISPFYVSDKDIRQITERIAPLSAVCGGFANANAGLNDGAGFYFAKDDTGGMLMLDMWLRSGDRTNSDIVIKGIKGQGKSTACKHIILNEYALGTKIIIIDPQGEYKEMTQKLGGTWINAAGTDGRLNPLQIMPVPRSLSSKQEEMLYKDEGNGMGDMALYIQHLEFFFSLYMKGITKVQISLLKKCVIELYNNFGITWSTDITRLGPEDFPIIKDLHELIGQKAKEAKENEESENYSYYNDLYILLEDAAKGADSILWNGYSTLSADAKCVCIDTSILKDASPDVKRAQYFLINSWTWQQMTRDRNEKIRVFYDEAETMIDPDVPQSLAFLKNCMDQDRKYEASMVIIAHRIADFLSNQVKMFGQALLDDPCYKIIFGCDGQDLLDTKELYKLTDAEEELLTSKKRSHALMLIGNKRMHVKFEIPDYEFSYFGTGGGR